MPCYKPLRAWRTDDNEIVFAERGRIHSEITLACGQCIGCRLERSRQWAVRCMHEARMHKQNCFLTLTYDDDHLYQKYWTGQYRKDGTKAYAGNLRYRDIQLFNKRLRTALSRGYFNGAYIPLTRDEKPQIRFYMAGEYGEQYGRPHYHMCLFGTNFNDKKYLGRTPTGHKLYTSEDLEKLWPLGFSSIGEVTFESAAYVARYVMKKITGQQQKIHYEKTDQETGEIIQLKPEFNNMSRRQGIGKAWLEKYKTDVYNANYAGAEGPCTPVVKAHVIVRGRKTNPPRYYDKQYQKSNPTEWEAIEYDRYLEGRKHYEDQLPHRLKAKQEVAAAQIKQLKRKI